jgi:hypothetical protein
MSCSAEKVHLTVSQISYVEVMKTVSQIEIWIVSGIIGTIVGGSGITGMVFFFIRRYIENKLKLKEDKAKAEELEKKDEQHKRRELAVRRMKVDDELQHCEGRLFFWIHKAIVTGVHNGDLEAAFDNYQKAEQAKKELDREIIVENEIE